VVEGLVILGEQSEAGRLYPLVRELVDTGAVALWPIFRFAQTVAGLAASETHQWEAVDHTPSGYLEMARDLFTDDPDDLLYDWLEKRAGWRVYYSGSPSLIYAPLHMRTV
jgi:hypothetical protein